MMMWERWLDVFAQGFGAEHGEARLVSDEIARANRTLPGAQTFLACLDDEPAGCGSMQIVNGLAWLGPAATIPHFGNGVQSALVAHRLHLAAGLGCGLAASTALANGPSAVTSFASDSAHPYPSRGRAASSREQQVGVGRDSGISATGPAPVTNLRGRVVSSWSAGIAPTQVRFDTMTTHGYSSDVVVDLG